MSNITTQADNQVLEFTLEGETYCVDIDQVNEIVNWSEDITELPDAPEYVLGIVDLRGRTTTIISPKRALDLGGDDGQRIVIFDSGEDDRAVGWAVDEVRQVTGVDDDEVDPSYGKDYLKGVVRRGDGFVLWIDPDTVLEAQETDLPEV